MNNRTRSLLCLSLVAALLGCSRPSPIVKKILDAGGQDPSNISEVALGQWLSQHPSVAADIVHDCRAIHKNPPPNWTETTDARVCSAAIGATTFKPLHVEGTGKTF